ncbi:MAG: transglycosylase domain-containing protein [Actinobacteria bacterium]|nr:transglycosylase domain-containing protein [Actinomycetota bacterium]
MLGTLGPEVRTIRRFVLTILLGGIGLAAGLIALAPQAKAVAGAGRAKSGNARLRELPQRSIVRARDGTILAVLHDEENRSEVSLKKVPEHTVRAVLDVEDARFYNHGGVDLRSTLRALVTNVSAGGVLEGGSTITQQLVKNNLLTPNREMGRKVKEAVLSWRLEDQMSKRQILEDYLNTVYFGNGAHGIQAAAETYFNKNAEDLTVADSAMLAGLIRNPVGYDPIAFPALGRVRRDQAVDRMVAEGDLTPKAAAAIKATALPTKASSPLPAPNDHFVEAVKQRLLQDRRLGETQQERYNAVFQGGLDIYTTLDPRLHELAKEKVDAILPDSDGRFTAAVATVEPSTGAVRALVGGRDFNTSEVNLALGREGGGTGRQPGSSFKTFVLVAALEDGFGPDDVVDGTSPCTITIPGHKPWQPENYEGEGGGVMSITDATAHSVNCAYGRIAAEVGLERVADVAKRMGITSPLEPLVPSMSLGSKEVSPLEMASAYSTLAADGIHHKPYFVEKILNRYGKVVFTERDRGERAISAQNARVAIDVLRAVVQRGTGVRAALAGRDVFGKTGTSENHGDAWFVGGTPQLVSAVWMGDPRRQTPMLNVGGIRVAGGTYPARIWGAFMGAALQNQPALRFPAPDPKLIPHGKSVLGADINASTTVPTGGTTTLLPPVTQPPLTVPSIPTVTFPPGFPYNGVQPGRGQPPPPNDGRPPGWPADWNWPDGSTRSR